MYKLNKLFTILLFALVSCNADNSEILKNRMKEYEKHAEEFHKKVNVLDDDSLKKKLYQIALPVFGHEMTDIKKQIIPTKAKYIDNPYFLLNSYDSYIDLTNNYIEGVVLSYSNKRGTKYKVVTSKPFEYPFLINSSWEETIFDNKERYAIKPKITTQNLTNIEEVQVFESGSWEFPKSFEINYPTENKTPIPIKVKANIQAELPKNIHQFCFSKKDVGKTLEKDGISVKLLNMENTYIEIEVVAPEGFISKNDACDQFDWLKIEAKDKTSQFISIANASNIKWFNKQALSELYAEISQQEEYHSGFLSNFFEKGDSIMEKEKLIRESVDKNKRYQFQMFRGVVEEIYVDVYDYSTPQLVNEEIVYPISDFRNLISLGEFKEIETTASVYDNEITTIFGKDFELSKDELISKIKINQQPALISKGSVVEFKYPNILSSKVIGDFDRFNKLKEITFLNENKKPIEIPQDSIGYNSKTERDMLVDFTVNRIEYHPIRFTETPYYVKGIAEVNLTSIERKIYDLDNLPKGVRIENNAVLLEQNIFNKTKYAMFVKDSSNRYLKLIHGYSGSVEINSEKKNQDISYYYGTPHFIEICTMTDTQKVDYEFDIELTREESNAYSTMWN